MSASFPARPKVPPAAATVAAVSALALVAATLLSAAPDMPFANYFGAIQPVTATLIVVVTAAAAHWILQSKSAFAVIRPEYLWRGLVVACAVGPLFAVPTVIADIALRFPVDINAPLPGALLFYPLMGYVAETAFHLVPLALLVVSVRLVTGQPPRGGILCAVLVAVALVEPIVQASGTFNAATPGLLDVFVLVHLTAFSLVLLTLYRRYGFLAAFAFRLAYYLVWHIVWGWARLQFLF